MSNPINIHKTKPKTQHQDRHIQAIYLNCSQPPQILLAISYVSPCSNIFNLFCSRYKHKRITGNTVSNCIKNF